MTKLRPVIISSLHSRWQSLFMIYQVKQQFSQSFEPCSETLERVGSKQSTQRLRVIRLRTSIGVLQRLKQSLTTLTFCRFVRIFSLVTVQTLGLCIISCNYRDEDGAYSWKPHQVLLEVIRPCERFH